MARTPYGGTPADAIAVVTDDDGDLAPETTVSLTVWDAETGGSQVTDLLDKAGNAITAVTPTATGRVWFQGPNGVSSSLWVEDSDGERWRIDPPPAAFGVASWNGSTGAVTYTPSTWSTLSGKPAVIAAGADAAAARAVISALGTPDLNVPNGVLGLDSDAKIPADQLPASLDLSAYAELTDLGVQVEAIATGDDSNLSAALASVSSTLGINGFIAVKVAGS